MCDEREPTVNVITGFGPFGSLTVNPSTMIARRVDERVDAAFVALPTSYARSRVALREAVRTHRPDVVLMFGHAAGTRGLRLETVAVNVASSGAADIEGVVMAGHPQEKNGPSTRSIRCGADALVRVVEAASCPVSVSQGTGGYVCNWTLYGVLGLDVEQVLFVHVGDDITDEAVDAACAVYEALAQA